MGFYEASDLVGAAIVLDLPALAKKAAKKILSTKPFGDTVAARAAALVLASDSADKENDLKTLLSLRERRLNIRNLRNRLRYYPRNPYMWVDLALEYVNLGQRVPAAHAFRVALALAPTDRFIRRVATRFFLHSGDPEQAHYIVATSQSLTHDPWLLSAEISTATVRGVDSRFIRKARYMVKSGSFSPFHISELAGSLATLEHNSGKHNKAKKLLRLSLIQPTDNSVAQAEWIARDSGAQYLIKSESCVISAEAQAFRCYRESRWEESVQQCRIWLSEEPFGSRQAVLGSYTSFLNDDDYGTSLWFAEQGLIANPSDQTLLNNKAFAQANLGDLEGASKTLSRTSLTDASVSEQIAIRATSGLVAFREGFPDLA